jgi:hypothetical protein
MVANNSACRWKKSGVCTKKLAMSSSVIGFMGAFMSVFFAKSKFTTQGAHVRALQRLSGKVISP